MNGNLVPLLVGGDREEEEEGEREGEGGARKGFNIDLVKVLAHSLGNK